MLIRRGSAGFAFFALITIAAAAAAAAEERSKPVVASPGHASEFHEIAGGCPNFQWTAVAGADRYELLVFHLQDGKSALPIDGNQPALRAEIPGGATGWAPPLGQCLAPEGRYAWSVRAHRGASTSEWAAPHLFRIARSPSRAELDHALDIVRRYRSSMDETRNQTSDSRGVAVAPLAGGATKADAARRDAPPIRVQQPAAVGAGTVGIRDGLLLMNPDKLVPDVANNDASVSVFKDTDCDKEEQRGTIRLMELEVEFNEITVDALCLCRERRVTGPTTPTYAWACFHSRFLTPLP